MIFELVYTSVPRGLRPGSKGYCTVLTTEGIPSALQDRLEGLCGYRHLFDPGSAKNPVNFMHHKIQIAGNTWHILSRIADAGSDYSQRSNLIAHHVAISQDEIARLGCSPATLMKNPGFFVTAWDGEPRRVSETETRSRLAKLTSSVRIATEWARVTGDAGYAGVLAGATSESGNRAIELVYPLGIDILSIIEEAALLLPKHEQWQTTFNSFFTKSIEDCKWRFYCDAATESRSLAGSAFDLTNLRNSGTRIDDSNPLVIAARTGKQIATQLESEPELQAISDRTPEKPTKRPDVSDQELKNDDIKIEQQDLKPVEMINDDASPIQVLNVHKKKSPPQLKDNMSIPSTGYAHLADFNYSNVSASRTSKRISTKRSKWEKFKKPVRTMMLLGVIFLLLPLVIIQITGRIRNSIMITAASQNENEMTQQPEKKSVEKKGSNQKPNTAKKVASNSRDPQKTDTSKPTESKTSQPKVADATQIKNEIHPPIDPAAQPGATKMDKSQAATEPQKAQTPIIQSEKSAGENSTDVLTIPAVAYKNDKTVLISDVYSKLMELQIKNIQDIKYIDITLPEGYHIPVKAKLNYLLTNVALKPEKQLSMKVVGNNKVRLMIPEKLKDMKQEELISTTFCTIVWELPTHDEIINIQLFSPLEVFKKKPEMTSINTDAGKIKGIKELVFYLDKRDFLFLDYIARKSLNIENNVEDDGLAIHSRMEIDSPSDCVGFIEKNTTGIPYLQLIKNNLIAESIKSSNSTERDIQLIRVKQASLLYPYTYEEIKKVDIQNYIKKKKRGDDLHFGFPTDRNVINPPFYVFYKNHRKDSPDLLDAATYNKIMTDGWKEVGSDELFNQFDFAFNEKNSKTRLQGVSIVAAYDVIQKCLTEVNNKLPAFSFELIWDKQSSVDKHWWLRQTLRGGSISKEDKDTLLKSRLIFADFSEPKN